jgi:hypothetical protein
MCLKNEDFLKKPQQAGPNHYPDYNAMIVPNAISADDFSEPLLFLINGRALLTFHWSVSFC